MTTHTQTEEKNTTEEAPQEVAGLTLSSQKIEGYVPTIGRRKTSTARIRLTNAKAQSVLVNEKPLEEYFGTEQLQQDVLAPFSVEKLPDTFSAQVIVKGGGIASQAGAVRHGIARALVKVYPELRKSMKDAGFLKRDPRMKERRKFGLKKARKAAQWSKR